MAVREDKKEASKIYQKPRLLEQLSRQALSRSLSLSLSLSLSSHPSNPLSTDDVGTKAASGSYIKVTPVMVDLTGRHLKFSYGNPPV